MNILPAERQTEVIAALTEGCSIRTVERLTKIHCDTIMRLGVRVGMGCARLHDRTMHSLRVGRIEIDEIWSYIGKKQRKVRIDDGAEVGDQYLFTALGSASKAILSYRLGKRDFFTTETFLTDLRERVLGRPEISSDSFPAYKRAVSQIFDGSDYGQISKVYAVEHAREASRRYSPAAVVAVSRSVIAGEPEHISTSYVERSNLTIRMASRRFTRLTNGFSKKLENHAAAIALFVAHYNFCRVHEALRTTPAMALGVADHVWSVSELVQAASEQPALKPLGRVVGRFTVIDGGR